MGSKIHDSGQTDQQGILFPPFFFFNLTLFLCCTEVNFFMGYDLLQNKLGGPVGSAKPFETEGFQGLLCSEFLVQALATRKLNKVIFVMVQISSEKIQKTL